MMDFKYRYEFGKDIIKTLKKHFKLDKVMITKCNISCKNDDATVVKLELTF